MSSLGPPNTSELQPWTSLQDAHVPWLLATTQSHSQAVLWGLVCVTHTCTYHVDPHGLLIPSLKVAGGNSRVVGRVGVPQGVSQELSLPRLHLS